MALCYDVVSKKKESIIRVQVEWKNPSLTISVCHPSASLVMPIGDPRDEFYYPTLTLMIQGSHRLENYLNIQDCLEKSLKIKFALKST